MSAAPLPAPACPAVSRATSCDNASITVINPVEPLRDIHDNLVLRVEYGVWSGSMSGRSPAPQRPSRPESGQEARFRLRLDGDRILYMEPDPAEDAARAARIGNKLEWLRKYRKP